MELGHDHKDLFGPLNKVLRHIGVQSLKGKDGEENGEEGDHGEREKREEQIKLRPPLCRYLSGVQRVERTVHIRYIYGISFKTY